MEIQCCKCHRVRKQDSWQWNDPAKERRISFSYCPDCLREFRHEAGLARREKIQRTPLTLALAYG